MAMSDLDATDPTTANYDAQQLVEEIAAGEEKPPTWMQMLTKSVPSSLM